ncbi:MAG TPA: hypothetical protein VNJ04_02790 [Gemmatimonadaceae bacterium]|nr:hypothetical protein [Gemmatimonadaceae bacterium]
MTLSSLALLVALSQQPAIPSNAIEMPCCVEMQTVDIPPHGHEDSAWLKAGILTMGAIAGADVATTAQAAERGGFYEVNPVFRPLFKQPALLGFANGALSAGIIYTVVKWHRSETTWKRRTAQVLIPVWIVFRGSVVASNIRVLRRPKR